MIIINRLLRFGPDRRGVTAVIFGVGAAAFVMFVGLAVDFSGAIALKSKLDLAADAGLLTGITTAAADLGQNQSNFIELGEAAGQQRFLAQAGQAIPPTSAITLARSGATIGGQLTWQATYNTYFGALFGKPQWQIGGVASSSVLVSAPYLVVDVLLDNSPSMEIAATNSDIFTMQQLTPCAAPTGYTLAPGAFYWVNGGWNQIWPSSGQSYGAYSCSSGANYNGGLACPIPANAPYTFSTFPANGAGQGPSCQGFMAQYNGKYPLAGSPCAFACHFDTSQPAGLGNDYYSLARSTIGGNFTIGGTTFPQIQLRFDLVKNAVNELISTMQADNLSINNLNIGIWTFSGNNEEQKVYPTDGTEAGNNWTTAAAAVGSPPTSPNTQDSGIQPYGGANSADTDFPDTMNWLATQLSPAGDGTTAATPKKVLIIVTDGAEDYFDQYGNRYLRALEPQYCSNFKNLGYTVYVLYTPYIDLMNAFYLENMSSIVNGTGANSLSYNLQQCASSSNDYIAAGDGPSIKNALQTFLKQALSYQARLTQ